MVIEAFKGLGTVKDPVGRVFRLTGLVGAILAWLVILVSIGQNPWFVFTKHAFSDLGGPRAENPWIFNFGLIVVSVVMIVYSVALVKDSVNKLESVGGAFAFIAGIFLALIGLYPSGTRPHTFVSIWFFTQADLVIIAWGIGLLMSGWKNLGMGFAGMGVLGPLSATIVEWPSAAVAETFGIVMIDVWVALMLRVHASRAEEPQDSG